MTRDEINRYSVGKNIVFPTLLRQIFGIVSIKIIDHMI